MNTDDKDLQDAKQANQKSKQGYSSSTSSAGYTSTGSSSLQEARQLNAQSATSSTGSGSSSGSTSTTSGEEEAKKLNEQSRQNKGK